MELTFTIPGSIRSKKNSKRVFKRGNFTTVLPSKAYLEWESQAREDVNDQITYYTSLPGNNLPSFPNAFSCAVSVKVFYKGRQPDLSGCLESIGDCLEGVIWENDSQILSWDGSRLYHDLENPRTEVIVVVY